MVKTFKQHSFKEKYEGEPGVGTTEYEDSIEDSNIGPHNIHEKDVLQKVNAWVGSIAHKEHYLKPEQAIVKLRDGLSKIGLTVPEIKIIGESDSVTVDVLKFGGRFGKTTETAPEEKVDDDGISHKKAGGLKLQVDYKKLEDGCYKLNAKLI